MGEIRKENDYPFDDGSRLETYTLEQRGGITKLTLHQDVPEGNKDMFEEVTQAGLISRITTGPGGRV